MDINKAHLHLSLLDFGGLHTHDFLHIYLVYNYDPFVQYYAQKLLLSVYQSYWLY